MIRCQSLPCKTYSPIFLFKKLPIPCVPIHFLKTCVFPELGKKIELSINRMHPTNQLIEKKVKSNMTDVINDMSHDKVLDFNRKLIVPPKFKKKHKQTKPISYYFVLI